MIMHPFAFLVHLQHAHVHLLVKRNDFVRVAHIAVGQLRNMHQTFLVHPDVYETTEIRNIGNDARQYHPFLQVVHRMHIGIERKGLYFAARVAPPVCPVRS